jgi:hypothetical protein
VLKHKSRNVLVKVVGALACVLFISSANAGFQPDQARLYKPAPSVELCYVLRNSEFYDGKQITVRATFRKSRTSSQLYCMACIDWGDVWMREVLPKPGEGSEGIRELNDLLNEQKTGLTVNGVFTGIFRGPGVYGYLGASTYQIEVREVRDMEVLFRAGTEPKYLPAEMKKKVCR